MRKFSCIYVIFVLISGTLGFFLRKQHLQTGFEPLTGLAVRGAPSAVILATVSFAYILMTALFAVILSVRFRTPDDYEDVFGTHRLIYPLFFTFTGIFWICGTVINVIDYRALGTLQTIDIYFAILSLLAANSVIFLAVEIYQGLKSKAPYALSIIPVVFLCFWLILIYRDNAANPVLQEYVFQCFAVIFSSLGFYYTTGFVYKKPSHGKAVVSYSGAIYFCAIMLSDNPDRGTRIIIISIVAVTAAQLFLLLRHLRHKPKEEKLNADKQLE